MTEEWPEWMLRYADSRTATRKAVEAMRDVDVSDSGSPSRWEAGVWAAVEHFMDGLDDRLADERGGRCE